MMQNPPLHTTPTTPTPAPPGQANQANQPPANNVPTIGRNRIGWYPRWWIIATLLCSIIIVIGMLVWQPLLCPIGQRNQAAPSVICQIANWPTIIQVVLIWILLFICWLGTLLVGFNAVEVPHSEQSVTGDFLRSISEFGPLHIMLLLQGCIALILINIMWWLDTSPPIPFAFLSMAIFIANCSYFQHLSPEDRRISLRGYGLVAVGFIALEILLKRNFFSHWPPQDEWPLLGLQILVTLVAISTFIWQPRAATQLTAQQAYARSMGRFASPFAILGSIWPFNRLFTPRPLAHRQPPQQNQGGQPPGTP